MKRTDSESFIIIVAHKSDTYDHLNLANPTYRNKAVKVLNVERIAHDHDTPLFCYELIFV